jgi:hypothetical protein
MAEQLAGVARAVTDLHKRVLWLTAAAARPLRARGCATRRKDAC